MRERASVTAIPFLRAEFPHDIVTEVEHVLTSGYVGAGPGVELFEREIGAYLGTPHVVCTASCTAALSLAYDDIGIGAGDVVLTTPMTCAATNTPLLHAAARIAWVDVDPLSGNVTAESLDAALQCHPDANAAIVVDWAGVPCDYEGLSAITSRRDVPLVLDAAQSFGSIHRGSLCPQGIDYVCYSFGPTKILSSVEGGAVIGRSSENADRMRVARWYGIDRARRDPTEFWEYDITRVGQRFTSNDVFATIGRQMLHRLPQRLAMHRRLAAIYEAELKHIQGLILVPIPKDSLPNYWMFTIHVEQRRSFLRAMHAAGIHAATPHRRNDRLACFANAEGTELPGVTSFGETYVCLPIGPWVRDEDVHSICEVIRRGW